MRQTQRSPEGPRHLHSRLLSQLSILRMAPIWSSALDLDYTQVCCCFLEFPRVTGLILRCAGKAGNPFQTTQGNRLSCRDQEGRRGSEEAVPGPSVFPSARGRDTSSKATLWVKAQHEGALPPPGIVRKDPRVPHTARRGA